MKNFLLGILVVISLSASSIHDCVRVAPVMPDDVVYVYSRAHERHVKDVISEYTKKGYIIKSVTSLNKSLELLIIFEKY